MGESHLWKPLPSSYDTSRRHLHQIAFFAVSPARQAAVGKMGLRPSPGGFRTPEFDGRVVRVEGSLIVDQREEKEASAEITTVRDAAMFLSGDYREVWYDDFHDPLEPIDPDEPLDVQSGVAHLLGEWFEFGRSVLEALGENADEEDDVSQVQIWPEHFDAANEMGSNEDSRRASYGASPGDDGIAEPYMYVAPWYEFDKSDPYWNGSHFSGSAITYSELASVDDPSTTARTFLRKGYEKLH